MTIKEFKAWYDGFMEGVCQEDGMTKAQQERVRQKLCEAVAEDQQITFPYSPYDGTTTDPTWVPQQQPTWTDGTTGNLQIGDFHGQTVSEAKTPVNQGSANGGKA